MCSSPRLFAACHVLRRLLMPRHSPCALFSLTCFWFSLFSLNYADNLQKFCKIVFTLLLESFPHFFYASSKCFHLSVALLSCFSFSVQFSRCSFRSLLKADTNHQIPDRLYPSSREVVGPSGLEPPTLRLSVVRSSQLSYGPISTSWWR